MNQTITFTLNFSIYELIALAFLGGAVFCLLVGIVGYKLDAAKFFKDKL